MRRGQTGSPTIGALMAALGVGLAAALVPVRASFGTTNIALLLVLVVISAAVWGGRIAGLIAGLGTALAYNFFHTKPYDTVRINDARDVVTVVLLAAAGLIVGELGLARLRQDGARRGHLRNVQVLEKVQAALAEGRTADDVWPLVQQGIQHTLHARQVVFVPGPNPPDVPVIERSGFVPSRHKRYVPNGHALPEEGAALPVVGRRTVYGYIVLTPDAAATTTVEERKAAVALSDALAVALKGSPSTGSLV